MFFRLLRTDGTGECLQGAILSLTHWRDCWNPSFNEAKAFSEEILTSVQVDSVAFLTVSSCLLRLAAWSRKAWSLGLASALAVSLLLSIRAESWSRSRLIAANWS